MKTEIKYGVIFAGIVVLYVLTEHLLGFNTTRHDIGQCTRYAGVIVPILGIFFGIKNKREKDLNGILTFGQGVKTGFWIALIQTTITTLWFLLYASIVNPEFLDTMLEFERSKMAAAGAPEASILQQLAAKRAFFAFPKLQLFQECFGVAYGVFFAAIFSLILRRKQTAGSTEGKEMHRNLSPRVTLILGMILFTSGLHAQDQPTGDLSIPGREHRLLDVIAGDWDVTVRYPLPSGKSKEGQSSCKAKWVLDGRFLMLEYSSTFAGKPLTVVRYLGFDKYRHKFVELQMESTHTDVMHSEGTGFKDNRTITCFGTAIDLATSKLANVRTVTVITDSNSFTVEMRYSFPDSSAAKTVLLIHKRKKEHRD